MRRSGLKSTMFRILQLENKKATPGSTITPRASKIMSIVVKRADFDLSVHSITAREIITLTSVLKNIQS